VEHVEEFLREYGEVDRLVRIGNFDQHVKEQHHEVKFSEVLEVQQNLAETEYFYNEGHFEGDPGRDAPLVMLGFTSERKFLCVPIEPASTRGTWRALTAFEPDGPFYPRLYQEFREDQS